MKAIPALLLVLLAGCANYATEQADAVRRGDLDSAERLARQAITQGHEVDRSWYNLGVVYQRRRQTDMAAQAFTMSARYGNAGAQQQLMAMRRPVPAADLAGSSGSDAAANILDGFNRGYQGGVTCNTLGMGGDYRTVCR